MGVNDQGVKKPRASEAMADEAREQTAGRWRASDAPTDIPKFAFVGCFPSL